VELRGLQPVPGPERYGRPFRIFKMWLSPQFTPSALFIGVLTASLGLSFGQGLPAIVTGNITGALVVAALCTRGPRTGMGQMPLSRAAFRKSDVLPGVVNWASAIGWVAFNNVFGALGVLAMIAIYLATVAADIVNDYAGSLSLQAAGITVRRPAIALINSAAAFGFSAWFLYVPGALYDKVENLLLFFTYWISAWLGVVVVDWVRRRGRVCVAELRDFGKLQ
jgi:purine-cytosine permease-like protein